MKKKRMLPKMTPEERARYDATTRKLEELIAKYRAKADQEAERRAAS